jgi:hypothetical protein
LDGINVFDPFLPIVLYLVGFQSFSKQPEVKKHKKATPDTLRQPRRTKLELTTTENSSRPVSAVSRVSGVEIISFSQPGPVQIWIKQSSFSWPANFKNPAPGILLLVKI